MDLSIEEEDPEIDHAIIRLLLQWVGENQNTPSPSPPQSLPASLVHLYNPFSNEYVEVPQDELEVRAAPDHSRVDADDVRNDGGAEDRDHAGHEDVATDCKEDDDSDVEFL